MDADGSPITVPIVTLAGLPAPASLTVSTYVAWVSPPLMYPVQKLGVVTNGRTQLRTFSMDPFMVRVTAERSPNVGEPSGRIVLRGGSPSTRLQPPDLMQFSVGATRDSGAGGMGGDATAGRIIPMSHDSLRAIGRAIATGCDSVQWTTVPHAGRTGNAAGPNGASTLVAAYVPAAPPRRAHLPDGRPGTIVQLSDRRHIAAGRGLRAPADRGAELTMYAFNGEYPGPVISVAQGTSIVVDYTNHLDQPSSVHWHGVASTISSMAFPD